MFNFNSHRENYAIITDGGEYFSYKQLEFLQKEFSHYISTRSLIILLTERNLASLIAYVSCIENGIISTCYCNLQYHIFIQFQEMQAKKSPRLTIS